MAAAGGSTTSLGRIMSHAAASEAINHKKMQFGLVTYMWGADWDLPTLLKNCETAGAAGVELRTEHAHKVEPSLSKAKRLDVKRRFADCPVVLVGLGTNEAFHYADQSQVKACIKRAKEFIKLSHDVGGSGVKVKPNDLPKGVPQQRTTAQIGRALNELAAFAADYGQQLRLEVHGQCAPLPIIAEIMQVADHPSVGVCWNSNRTDLDGDGLEHNFKLVAKRLGATLHAHDLEKDKYPYADLFRLLKEVNYDGWVLIEASDKPVDRVQALAEQRKAFERLCA
jgi:sugar phosphate isomerase/epimerase